MAQRRMFSMQIVDSDAFLEMPATAQLLYFHLCMRSDDDGFVDKPKSVMRLIGCREDDIKVLLAKRYILSFESGIVVIKHWLIHNTIRKDRYHETTYLKEKSQLSIKENSAYTLRNQMATTWQPNGNQMATEVRLGKARQGKANLGEGNTDPPPALKPYGKYKNVMLSDDDLETFKKEQPNNWETMIEKLSAGIAAKGYRYENHLAALRKWAASEYPRGTAEPAKNPALNYAQRDVKDEDYDKIFDDVDAMPEASG